jgi:hypothetical protein
MRELVRRGLSADRNLQLVRMLPINLRLCPDVRT